MNKGVVQLICSSVTKNIEYPFLQGENSKSYGSGFMFCKDRKYILTCSHCIEDVVHIYVQIPKYGKKNFEAKVLSFCHNYDIALLEILDFKDTTISYLELNSNGMKDTNAGDKVEVLGYPLGQNNLKMTQGIVSGHQMSLYQIDSPINGGNSGGPLLRDGKVIGIISSGILFANDIGYAVPIERFLNIYDLMKEKKVINPPEYFGFSIQKNPERNKNNSYIYNIMNNSLVAKSKPKIKKGDILLKLGNYKVDFKETVEHKWMYENESFKDFLLRYKIGSEIPFQVQRGSKKINGKIPVFEIKPRIYELIHPYDIYEYCMIGGIVIVPVSISVLKKSILKLCGTLIDCSSIDECHESITSILDFFTRLEAKNQDNILTIINILGGSSGDEYFSKGDFIDKVNGKNISSIKNLVQIIYKNKETTITVETNLGKKCIFSRKDIISENEKMKKQYEFNDFFKCKK